MKQMYLGIKELAERLGIERKSARKLASFERHPAKDRIPARRIGRLIKFYLPDVEEWEKGRRGRR